MSQSGIESVLGQMRSLAAETGGDPARGQVVNTVVGKGGFAEELQNTFQRINALQQHAGEQIKAFEAGEPGLELNEVMVDSQKAGVAFQFGVQLRNRLVSAYKDIMNMQV